jgi:threonine dehydrogenase-like Zn-dependent dehydrogenase
MNVISLEKPGKFELLELPRPSRLVDHALVKVHRIGICGTDLHAFAGKQPFFEFPRVLGHELGVEILEIEDNALGLKVGDHCSVEPYINNPGSMASLSGKPNCCEDLQVMGVHRDGGMCEYLNVPIRKLHKSEKLTYDQLALVETLCIGAHGVERAKPIPGEFVLCIGTGPIGLGAIQFAKACNAQVIAMDMSNDHLKFCNEQIGIEWTINPAEDDVESRLKEICSGGLPSVVIDATGNSKSMENTFNLISHGGRIVFIGLFPGSLSFDDPSFHKKEVTLMGSRNALPKTFEEVIAKMEDGSIDTSPWITHRVSLQDLPQEFEGIKNSPNLLKAMIEVV